MSRQGFLSARLESASRELRKHLARWYAATPPQRLKRFAESVQTQLARLERDMQRLGAEQGAFSTSAQAHLAGLQAEVEGMGVAHTAFSRNVRAHLNGLQEEIDRLSAARGTMEARIDALRMAAANLEVCLADVEESQTWVSAAITRGRVDSFPE